MLGRQGTEVRGYGNSEDRREAGTGGKETAQRRTQESVRAYGRLTGLALAAFDAHLTHLLAFVRGDFSIMVDVGFVEVR